MNVKKFLILMMIFINGCFLDFDPVHVISISPDYGSIVKPNVKIIVLFSKPMSIEDTENSFILSGKNGIVKGNFLWEDKDIKFIFTPEKDLINNEYYIITIGKSSKDKKLNNITKEYRKKIHIGEDFIHPVLLSTIPANLSDTFKPGSDIIITFSEPINRMTVERNLSLSPHADFYFQWDSQEIVKLVLNKDLIFNTDYILSGFKKCSDISGNEIQEIDKIYFKSGENFVRPVVEEILSYPLSHSNSNGYFSWIEGDEVWEGVDEKVSINFKFDKSMNRKSFEKNITFEPSESFYTQWNSDNSCTIFFENKLKSQIEYRLNIKKGLSDVYGNELEKEKIIYFKTNKYLSPKILSAIIMKISEEEISILEKNSIIKAGLESSDNNYYKIKVSFNIDMNILSVHDNILLSRVYGDNPEMSGAIKEYNWLDNKNLILTISTIKGDNLYKIKFLGSKNGISSIENLYFEFDLNYYFIFDSND